MPAVTTPPRFDHVASPLHAETGARILRRSGPVTRPRQTPARKILVAAELPSADALRGIARYARAHDWHLVTDMLFNRTLPRGWKGDGILVSLPYRPELLAHVEQSELPCVAFAAPGDSLKLPGIGPDDDAVGRLAADHLLERAHRSFAWAPYLNDTENRERLAGFQARLAEHGCTCRTLPSAHLRIGPYWQGCWTEYRQALREELQRLPRPSAILACNDSVAAEVVDACRDAGLSVPDEMAVLGVGNSMLCDFSPVAISSVDLNLEEVGFRAAAMLDAMIGGEEAPEAILRIPPAGVVTRVSTNIVAVHDARVARALAYIAEHFPDPMLSVGDVASAVGMSRRNLERSFRDETGRTVKEHIITIRMQEASRLLKTHLRAKSSDVAALVGLADPGTFFRVFRRYFGMSPRAHRDWAVEAMSAARAPLPGFQPTARLPSLSPLTVKPPSTAA